MTSLTLYQKISGLPDSEKNKLLNYLEELSKKHIGSQKKSNIHPKAGCMKGTFTMHEDFDEPLEDFKEYME